ncbi:alpha/beta hydrolase [Catellatospora methionotrophica]|uniref:Alpha/beta hydrolase n=1 Tax=Catellatospora methionotrophica TaxID=121620 RepID=A0A8J3L8U0_9ACTN|nr:alpha/beta hydrolase [Catellatospora methionotrophica]GIG14452.1 alpha/beta hydrolase [Catellatospora methionotrophica]
MTLSHDVAGDGPTLVLLHSTVCDRRMWDPQLPALTAAGYRVVRCDLRGFGDSPMPDRPYNNADDVAELLDALGVERAALVGASGGGRVALEFAARMPQRTAALALLCTAVADHEPGEQLRAFGDEEDTLLEAGDVAAATELNVTAWIGPQADDATRELVRTMQRHAFEVQLAPGEEHGSVKHPVDHTVITAPALLVSGEHDFADFTDIAVRLSKEIAGSRHVHLDWAGHLPSMERPEDVNAVLVAFLREAFPAV